MTRSEKIRRLWRSLRDRHGEPTGQWSLWCRRPKTRLERETVILESILTQRANWKNVQMAVENLRKKRSLGLVPIEKMPTEHLAILIRPSGFYRQKAERLKSLARFILTDCGGMDGASGMDTPRLRESLLALKGVGPETADDILLYAFDRPVFVIDEYTRRLAERLCLSRDLSYAGLQIAFTASLRKDYRLYQDFHALIVIEGKSKGLSLFSVSSAGGRGEKGGRPSRERRVSGTQTGV